MDGEVIYLPRVHSPSLRRTSFNFLRALTEETDNAHRPTTLTSSDSASDFRSAGQQPQTEARQLGSGCMHHM